MREYMTGGHEEVGLTPTLKKSRMKGRSHVGRPDSRAALSSRGVCASHFLAAQVTHPFTTLMHLGSFVAMSHTIPPPLLNLRSLVVVSLSSSNHLTACLQQLCQPRCKPCVSICALEMFAPGQQRKERKNPLDSLRPCTHTRAHTPPRKSIAYCQLIGLLESCASWSFSSSSAVSGCGF